MLELLTIDAEGVLCASLPTNKKRIPLAIRPHTQTGPLVDAGHTQAHLGIGKTIGQLRLQSYWPNMAADVQRTVANNTLCQQAKKASHRTHRESNHLYAGWPWQVVAIDVCGPLPDTTRGNTEILILADHFTSWYDAIPIANGRVARTLEERVFSYFGISQRSYTVTSASSLNQNYSPHAVNCGDARKPEQHSMTLSGT